MVTKRKLKFGDLILERSGGGPKQPVGRVITFEKSEGLYSFSNFTSVIRARDQSILSFRFLHRLLYWYYISGVTERMQRRSTGIRNLDFNSYKQLPIPLPPLSEQKRIVAILDEAFAGIATAVANTEKNLANARELFEIYLNNVFAQKGEEWVESTLGESCEFYNGKAHEKQIDENGNFIVVNSKFIASNGATYKRAGSALFPLHLGDIVMVMSDVPKGKALAKCYLIDEEDKYSLNQRICAIRSDKFEKEFLFYHLNRHSYLLNFDNGENQTNLRKGDILKCPLFIPSLDEQHRISTRLKEFSEKTNRLEAIYQHKLANLAELKQSILRKAFSGELTAQPERALQEAVA